ncbi:MAG TPA: hypothetical protein VF103_00075 [Polyangiaceae bacterium]
MADSKNTMVRLDRLEGAFVHITDLLVLHSERMDFGFSSLRDEMHAMREEGRALREETRAMRESLTDRLDRLIAITTKERTSSIERLASIEARLARLEEHAGI